MIPDLAILSALAVFIPKRLWIVVEKYPACPKCGSTDYDGSPEVFPTYAHVIGFGYKTVPHYVLQHGDYVIETRTPDKVFATEEEARAHMEKSHR